MFVRVSYTDGIIFMVKVLARGEHHIAVSYVPDLATSTIKTTVIETSASKSLIICLNRYSIIKSITDLHRDQVLMLESHPNWAYQS